MSGITGGPWTPEEILAGKHLRRTQAPRTDIDYRAALEEAEVWADGGYSAESRAYWTGMRDTLRVVLGITTRQPPLSIDDAAATTLLRNAPEARR